MASQVTRNKALNVTWTPPPSGGAARIFMSMDIAHHGGGAARIECDVPDTGSATIPAGLINQLLDRGSAGFPKLTLTRRTVDSVTIAPGCVDFLVSSSVERPLTGGGRGVVHLHQRRHGKSLRRGDGGTVPCPTGRPVGNSQNPKALTCGP